MSAPDPTSSCGAPAGAAAGDPEWATAALSDLIDHILASHHVFARRELARLGALLERLLLDPGPRRPELEPVAEAFRSLAAAVPAHLEGEERVLFPAIRALEAGTPRPPVREPIRALEQEHRDVGERLRRLRARAGDYRVPPGAGPDLDALYRGLEGLEADLRRHTYLEDGVLFPRAEALEAAGR